jgi:phosphoribosylaminoimidazole-succinocarboxamide synthase
MDEIHTPDSSRYFHAAGFDERQANGERQLQLSKEFVREWLMANDFMGKPGQNVPEMSDEWLAVISGRYIELYEKLIGEKFVPMDIDNQVTYDQIVECLKTMPK